MTDLQAAQRLFFENLFPDLRGFIELRGISRSGKPPIQRFYPSVDELLAAIPQSAEAQKGYDIYFGVLPRDAQDGTKKSITLGTTAWVDIDHNPDNAAKTVRAFRPPYTALVHSGHGVHAYWALKEAIPLDSPEATASYESRLRGLAKTLGGDPQACDIGRIMRVPGTWNMKAGHDPVHHT